MQPLEAERIAREIDILEERRALAQEEAAWCQAQAPVFRSATAGRRREMEAAGFAPPGGGGVPLDGWLQWLDRLAPLLEAMGPPSGPLAKILTLWRQVKGVQAVMGGHEDRSGASPGRKPSVSELASLVQRGAAGGEDPMGLAQGQKLDPESASFLRSLGVEASAGEEMTEALRRIATGLNAGQKAELKEKASKLLEGLLGAAPGGPRGRAGDPRSAGGPPGARA
ncbi:hypothetical protein [Limnochorda pilosa]|uniref:Uncharacterized protein n=1 Tax=Limnochorda pilosa TaxID=1555112 RepID=A0A0K2SQN8_LIMPI|nr:hypothetical protein [Limnochorda pilosa]BAS29421.1 hypothetical protein LIP_3613 [Limnochorda pilosa]